MDFEADAHASHVLLAKSAHLSARADLESMGYHALSVCVSGSPGAPRYTAAFARHRGIRASKWVAALSHKKLDDKIAELAADGWAPYIISATGNLDNAIYAAEFWKPMVGGPAVMPTVNLAMPFEMFKAIHRMHRADGKKLIWADCFGDEGALVCALWAENPAQTAFKLENFVDFDESEERFHALTQSWVRPELVSYGFDDKLLKLYVDSKIGEWRLLTNTTTAKYEAKRKDLAKEGLFPYRITARGAGSDARVTAIFAAGNTEKPRKHRVFVKPGQPTIDAEVRAYMGSHNLRSAALAVVKGTRLVYAQGYNYSEAAPAYPDVGPETRFRLASVTKTFCAVAIWRLIQQGDLTLERKLWDVLPTTVTGPLEMTLPLTIPGKAQLKRLKKISIQHLLESRSGLKQGTTTASADAADGPLPCTAAALARYMLATEMRGEPGTISLTEYGNTDNVLLGQVVRHVMKKPSFEAALKVLVLDPLGMTRTRSARSLRKDQEEDEARYHITVFNAKDDPIFPVEKSVMTDDRPLVPLQYGARHFESFDGSSGLSSAVIDVARLAAMFACDVDNPVLNKSNREGMLEAGVAASDAAKNVSGAHGFHGFDNPSKSASGTFMIDKGGSLRATRARVVGEVGGTVIVFAFGGEKKKGGQTNWLTPISNAVDKISWPTGDLFPTFGMPTLKRKLVIATPFNPDIFDVGDIFDD